MGPKKTRLSMADADLVIACPHHGGRPCDLRSVFFRVCSWMRDAWADVSEPVGARERVGLLGTLSVTEPSSDIGGRDAKGVGDESRRVDKESSLAGSRRQSCDICTALCGVRSIDTPRAVSFCPGACSFIRPRLHSQWLESPPHSHLPQDCSHVVRKPYDGGRRHHAS